MYQVLLFKPRRHLCKGSIADRRKTNDNSFEARNAGKVVGEGDPQINE